VSEFNCDWINLSISLSKIKLSKRCIENEPTGENQKRAKSRRERERRNLNHQQGDQIDPIFAYWVTVYVNWVFIANYIQKYPNFLWATFYDGKT
jgi:hypothetical protein